MNNEREGQPHFRMAEEGNKRKGDQNVPWELEPPRIASSRQPAEGAPAYRAEAATVHAKAIENLKKLGPISEEAIAKAVKGESGSVIGFDDRYNAVRILLVQLRLAEGEKIAVMIPNRHILDLLPLPSVEGGLDRSRDALGLAEFDVDLLDRPIGATRESWELL